MLYNYRKKLSIKINLRNEATSKCCFCVTQRAASWIVCKRWVVIKNLIGSRYYFFDVAKLLFHCQLFSGTNLKFPNGSGVLLTMCTMFYEYYFLRSIEAHSTVFVSHIEFCILFIDRTRCSVSLIDNSGIFFSIYRKTSFYENLHIKEYS